MYSKLKEVVMALYTKADAVQNSRNNRAMQTLHIVQRLFLRLFFFVQVERLFPRSFTEENESGLSSNNSCSATTFRIATSRAFLSRRWLRNITTILDDLD